MNTLLRSIVNMALVSSLLAVGCKAEDDLDLPDDGCWVGDENGEIAGKAEFGECHPLNCGAACAPTDLGGQWFELGNYGTPCDPVPSYCSGVASFDEDYEQ